MLPYISEFQKLEEGYRRIFSEIRNSDPSIPLQQRAMDKTWIEEGLRKPGKSKTGLAKALGRAPSMVTALLKPERELKVREVKIIAGYLEVEAPVDFPQPEPEPAVDTAFITGEVAGGVWTEPGYEFEPIPTTVARPGRWPAGSVYLLRVRGSSINRKATDGDLVMCLDTFAAPRRFKVGDWVIAERERNGMIETTVKKVDVEPSGDFVLMPDSDDPRHQNPIPIGEVDGDLVRVRAFVLQFIQQATDF